MKLKQYISTIKNQFESYLAKREVKINGQKVGKRDIDEFYAKAGRTDTRKVWDLAAMANIDICSFYKLDGVHDEHIDTLLKRAYEAIDPIYNY
jgi:hypothetical protein